MADAWHFFGSTTLQRLGKLMLREDAWRLPTGALRRDPVLHVGTTVGIVPFVDPGHVLLVRQFRHLARADSWELPGGGGQPGEDPEAAAQRELREESGYRAGRLTFLARFFPRTPTSTRRPTATSARTSLKTRRPRTRTSASSGAWCRFARRWPWRGTTASRSRCPRSRSSPRRSSWDSDPDCPRGGRSARLPRRIRLARDDRSPETAVPKAGPAPHPAKK